MPGIHCAGSGVLVAVGVEVGVRMRVAVGLGNVAVAARVGVRDAIDWIGEFKVAVGVAVGAHTRTPGTLSSREPAIQGPLLSRNQVPSSFRATICKAWPAHAAPARA